MRNLHAKKQPVKVSSICFFIFFLFFLGASLASLSAAELTGVVKDLKKIPMEGVEVTLKGTSKAALTNMEGRFTLPIPDESKGVTLIFKRSGYHPLEMRTKVENKEMIFEIHWIPQEYLLQKVTVTAMNKDEKSIDIPMAENALSNLDVIEKIPENVTDSLSETTGVHFIGSGGFSSTPSIRGLARRRVLILLDGARVISDRRVGASASFIPPEFIERIEVVRSASSVLYGSDALGGVINIMTRNGRDLDQPASSSSSLNLNLGSVSNKVNTGFTYLKDWGKWRLLSGFQFTRAGNYSAPGNMEIAYSGYKYFSGLFDISYQGEKRSFYLGYMGGAGDDVGKPSRANDALKYSIVPKESDHFIRVELNEKNIIKKGTIQLSLYVNPGLYKLENVDKTKDTIEHADTTALNLGAKTAVKISPSSVFSYQLGLEWYSRQNVCMKNINRKGSAMDVSYPLDNGLRHDVGLFMAFDYAGIRTLDINGGIRYTYFMIEGDVSGEHKKKNTTDPAFFLGVTKKFGKSVSVFCNVGRAFRFPSLSESFYTGITGRKLVIGNPNLKPESSFNIDGGLKLSVKHFSLGAYVFSYKVKNMIERYKRPDNAYTYDNIFKGNIYGGEIEAQYTPVTNLDFFGHFFHYKGKSEQDDQPINDVPASRFLVGGKFFLNRFWVECDLMHSFKKKDAGPAELVNEAYSLLNVKSGYYISSAFYIYIKLANILDETYYPNADPDIPLSPGFNVSAGLHFNF